MFASNIIKINEFWGVSKNPGASQEHNPSLGFTLIESCICEMREREFFWRGLDIVRSKLIRMKSGRYTRMKCCVCVCGGGVGDL